MLGLNPYILALCGHELCLYAMKRVLVVVMAMVFGIRFVVREPIVQLAVLPLELLKSKPKGVILLSPRVSLITSKTECLILRSLPAVWRSGKSC